MWWYRYLYPPPYYLTYMGYPPLDIFSIMSTTLNWMIYPYYWLLYLEAFRASFDTWRKVLESFGHYLSPPKRE